MTNFVDKVEALKKAERFYDATNSNGYLYLASSSWEMPAEDSRGTEWVQAENYDKLLSLILELCDKALEAERLQAEIARLKGDR